MTNFPCSRCGECCRNISHIDELNEFDNGTGVCVNLADDNSCNIYVSRPAICQVDLTYDKHFASICSWEEFLRKNAEACNQLQISAMLDVRYRINVINLTCKSETE